MPTLVDSHCHLDFPDFAGEIPAVVARADAAGVTRMVTICTRLRQAPQVQAIAEAHPGVFWAAGTHPMHAAEEPMAPSTSSPPWPRTRSSSASARPASTTTTPPRAPPCSRRACASTSRPPASPRLPLIVHARDADADMARILAEEHAAAPFACVMHCFTSGAALAETALSLGFYLSISGIATFRSADALRAIFAAAPRDRLLVETDSPYLAPQPHRGKRNEPAYTADTARLMAAHLGLDPDGVRRPHHRQLRPPLRQGRRMKPARLSCSALLTLEPQSFSSRQTGGSRGAGEAPLRAPRAAQGHEGADCRPRPSPRMRANGAQGRLAPWTPDAANGKPTFQPLSSRFPAPENPAFPTPCHDPPPHRQNPRLRLLRRRPAHRRRLGRLRPGEPEEPPQPLLAPPRAAPPAGTTRALIDTTPDLRSQLLAADTGLLDGVAFTHPHADHIHGIDDLSTVVQNRRARLPVWADAETAELLMSRFAYVFVQPAGSLYPPILDLRPSTAPS